MSLKVTILYDNEVYRQGLRADWGFACLVEGGGRTVLFDTGADGAILLENMSILGVDPLIVDMVVISHDHWDHTGGLRDFLARNGRVPVYVPPSLRVPPWLRENAVVVDAPLTLDGGIHLTGELGTIEQALVVDSPEGLVVIAGCSHPGVRPILEAASRFGPVFGLIGGLHGFSDFEVLEDLGLVCATHCTVHIREIRARFPYSFVEGGAGRVIEIP